LLVLRASVAVTLLMDAFAGRSAIPGWAQGVAILLSVSLFMGYLTPIAAAAGLLLHGLIWFRLDGGVGALDCIVVLDMIALALLGPGGYSVDAARFGRRIVVLPPS
jgi:hypothetical protein